MKQPKRRSRAANKRGAKHQHQPAGSKRERQVAKHMGRVN